MCVKGICFLNLSPSTIKRKFSKIKEQIPQNKQSCATKWQVWLCLCLSKWQLCRRYFIVSEAKQIKTNFNEAIVICDTVYWGKRYSFGVIVFKDSISKKILWRKFVYRKEQRNDYLQGLKFIQNQGYKLKAVVSDILCGLVKSIIRYHLGSVSITWKRTLSGILQTIQNKCMDLFASNHKCYVLLSCVLYK